MHTHVCICLIFEELTNIINVCFSTNYIHWMTAPAVHLFFLSWYIFFCLVVTHVLKLNIFQNSLQVTLYHLVDRKMILISIDHTRLLFILNTDPQDNYYIITQIKQCFIWYTCCWLNKDGFRLGDIWQNSMKITTIQWIELYKLTVLFQHI